MDQYKRLKVNDNLALKIKNMKLPETLGFGVVRTPIMVYADYENDAWQEPVLCEWEKFLIDPSAKVLHYGQAVFEGMKAYRKPGQMPLLFRPLENFKRFNKSAVRMAMPEISEELFMSAICSIVSSLKDLIPGGAGESLYIRPFMVATGLGIGLAPSDRYRFMVIASPSGAYFKSEQVSVLIERNDCRAAPGGTGAAKAAGNYGGSIKSAKKARSLGYDQTLWLDATKHQYVEELSGMNFFALIDDKLYTPKLTDTILPGVTRDSLIQLATREGIEVCQLSLDIGFVIDEIASGKCTELFACGTAAAITPIASLGEEDGTRYTVKHAFGPMARKLKDLLIHVQETGKGAPEGWSYPVT